MKSYKFFFVLLIMQLFISCNYRNEHEYYRSPVKSKEILFKEAYSMKGLSDFIIGKTTVDELMKINKAIKKDKRYGEYYYEFWNGNEFLLKDNKNSFYANCPDLSKYEISKYYIGTMEIEYLELDFFKNCLYEIHCHTSDNLRDAFTQKYGEGIKEKFRDITGPKDNDHLKAGENITWENEFLITTYDDFIESQGSKITEFRNYFSISSKSKNIQDEIRKCNELENKKIKEQEEKEKQENINKI